MARARRAARRRPRLARVAGLGAAAFIALITADRLLPPPSVRSADLSVSVVDRDGRMLRPYLAHDGAWRLAIAPEAVDANYLRMLKAYEDRRFDRHWGVDPLAVARALGQIASTGHVVSGASTLTMQTARLMAPGARGISAKLAQSARALQLEWRYSKHDILGLYLTLAPYGGNLEGVRSASLAYFGKEPKSLTLGEAALLVALPQSPERLRPDLHPEAARRGRDKVLTRLVERGVLSQARAGEAMAEPIPVARRPLPFVAPHLADRMIVDAKPGAVIGTEIDSALQSGLEALARREAQAFPDGANLAILVVDNATRCVRAYLGNADFWGRHGQIDLAEAVRSPGSALKPFLYGVIFDDFAAHPETLIEDRPTVFGSYAPRNFDRGFQGTVSLRQALQLSLNVPAVALLDRYGPVRFAARLGEAGARLHLPDGVAGPSLPLILGGVGITLEDLTTLYVGLAQDGRVAPLRYRADGPADQKGAELFAPVAAYYVRDILQGSPLPDGWSSARGIERRPIAFKTGTSYGFRDAWAMGVSPRFTVGVWVGRPDASTRPGSYGRNAAAPILLRAFDLLPAEPGAFPPAPKGAVIANANEDLPRALRRFHVGRVASLTQPDPRRKLAIAFPPDGASVALPDGAASDLMLKAVGGHGRLFWLVDGVPLTQGADESRRVSWHPEGEGFARITVTDDAGSQASANVRLLPAR